MQQPPPRPWRALGYFLALALLLRWGTSFISVINHDESTYITIAAEMLRGEVYLRDVIDTKPIGIFWLYELLIRLTGGSIVALRLATTVWVAGTAWLLYAANRRATGSERAGRAAGVAYCFVTGVYTYYGISPNSELFFNALTVGAVALAVAPRVGRGADRFGNWLPAGLLLGAAVIIKPFAAAESLGVGLFLLWYYLLRERRGDWPRALGGGGLLLAGFAVPLLVVYAYFHHHGMVSELLHYTFGVNRNYPVELAWYLRLKYLGDYLLRYAPLVLLAGAAVYGSRRAGVGDLRRWTVFLLVYGLLVTVMVLSPGKRFGHYQIQLHPVLCLLAGAFFDPRLTVWARVRAFFGWRSVFWGGAAGAALIGLGHFLRFRAKPDVPRQIEAYLRPRLGPDDRYFTPNGYQIAYYLLGRDVPTPYVHSSLLFYDHHVHAFGLDPLAEAERLLADPRLRFVIVRAEDTELDGPLMDRLLGAFRERERVGELVVWERHKY